MSKRTLNQPEAVIHNIHQALYAQGPSQELLGFCLEACQRWPESRPLQVELLLLLTELPVPDKKLPLLLRNDLSKVLGQVLPRFRCDLQALAPWLAYLLKALPDWPRLQSASQAHVLGVKVPELLKHPLLQWLLTQTCLCDPELEICLTQFRHLLLKTTRPLGSDWLEVLFLMARQAWNNEFIAYQSPEELDRLRALKLPARPADLTPRSQQQLLLSAMYQALDSLPVSSEIWPILAKQSPEWAELIALSVDAPRQERRLAADLSSLTPIDSDDPCLTFYEQYPYPRWLSCEPLEPISRLDQLSFLFPDYDWAPHFQMASETPSQVLIAGCGTGQHLITQALANPAAQITGLDISRASLAYTARMLEKYTLQHPVSLYQADLMQLQTWEQRFDLIECGGVLQHLPEPETGFKHLLQLLKPGGLFKLGLYSRRARRGLLKLKQQMELNPDSPDQALCEWRWQLLQSEKYPFLKHLLDFYSLSNCRDLLLHPREQSYTLPELSEWFSHHHLEVLGLELWNPLYYRLYAERFGDDPRQVNLAYWDQLEAEHPDMFAHMYVVWLKKSA